MMCSLMSLIALKSDYIYKADRVYRNLQESEEVFEMEAQVLNRFKCMLLQKAEIEDFSTGSLYVEVASTNDGYRLFFADYVMNVTIYDKLIVSFNTNKA